MKFRKLTRMMRLRHRPKRRNPPGSVPGMITVDPAMPAPTMHLMAYTATDFQEHEVTDMSEVAEALLKFPFVWLQVEGLGSEPIIRSIKDAFNLHRLAMEDVVNLHQRAKIEEYDDHLYMVMRLPILKNSLQIEQVSLFLGKNFVISFEEHDNDVLEPVKERIRRKLGFIRNLGPDFLAYAIIDAIIDRFFPVLEHYSDLIEDVEFELLRETNANAVKKIYMIKQDLLGLRRAIWPARDAINAMIRDENKLLSKEVRVYLRDCYDHVVQLIDILETDRELSADLMDLHMTSLSNRINEVMKVLTIISSIFIPLSFVASVYGMNFNTQVSHWNMPELNYPFGYPLVLLLMVAIAAIQLVFMWKKGWLGGKGTQSGTAPDIHHRKENSEHYAQSHDDPEKGKS